jgi:hypothetical protein
MAMVISLFGSFASVAIIISAIVLIVAPTSGREMLKNTAAACGIVVIGWCLLHVCCATLHW